MDDPRANAITLADVKLGYASGKIVLHRKWPAHFFFNPFDKCVGCGRHPTPDDPAYVFRYADARWERVVKIQSMQQEDYVDSAVCDDCFGDVTGTTI